MERPDGRTPEQLREITFQPGFAPHATGSVLVCFGNTQVICSATIDNRVPRWMKQQKVKGGWLTAEYSMLPYSTLDRKDRDISRGKIDPRSSEIQRLIGRSLRAVTDLKALGERTVWIDCDVLQADGGTRTAAVTGGCVAMALAFDHLVETRKLKASPLVKKVAAVSAGVFQGEPVLDLNYPEDKEASVDCNFVMTDDLQFVEIQGSGEEATFTEEEMARMLALSKAGIARIAELQEQAIQASRTPATDETLTELTKHFGADKDH